MNVWHKVHWAVCLLCLVVTIASAAYAGHPRCSLMLGTNQKACWFEMPNYDQNNPNFAAYISPSTFKRETGPVANVVCGVVNNPFDQSWLPYGPMIGDDHSLWTESCSYGISEICCPTAEAMALMGAIASKSASTSISGWTNRFYAGQTPDAYNASVGLMNQIGPIFPFVPDPRLHMELTDIQRVIDMALEQHTMPNAGGDEDYITKVEKDFSPAAIGKDFGMGFADPSDISNATFIADLEAGAVIVIALHYWTANIKRTGSNSSEITFTSNTGGHCITVRGFSVMPISDRSGSNVSQGIDTIDPDGGFYRWVSIVKLANGNYTRGPASRKLTLPEGWTSVGVWPEGDPKNAVNSVWDITDKKQIRFIDEYHTLKVP